MRRLGDLEPLRCVRVVRYGEKAILVAFRGKELWLPKSVIIERRSSEHGALNEEDFIVQGWFARKLMPLEQRRPSPTQMLLDDPARAIEARDNPTVTASAPTEPSIDRRDADGTIPTRADDANVQAPIKPEAADDPAERSEPRRRGRKPVDPGGVSVVSVRMPTAWLERYREIATEERRDVAQVLRIALETFLLVRRKLRPGVAK